MGFRRIPPADPASEGALDVWYPAARPGAPMRFGDYLALADDLRGMVPGSPPLTLSIAVTGDSTALDPALTARILGSPMAATRDAAPASARYPLLLWTPRYGTTVAQSVLSEFLASHGFVVAFPRSVTPARLPFELPDSASRGRELDGRVADIRKALTRLGAIPGVDAGAIGLLAWSYTGEMATTFQRAEPRVRLVAGLSTNLLTDWIYRPQALAGWPDSTRLRAAYAIITQGDGNVAPPSRLDRVDGARYFVTLPGLAHGSFNALEGYLPSLLGVTKVQRWSVSGPAGAEGYRAVAAMLLRLVRHHVRDRSDAPLSSEALGAGLRPGVALVR